MTQRERLRIGVLVDDDVVDANTFEFIGRCRAHPALAVDWLIVQALPSPPGRSRLARLGDWVRRRGIGALAGKLVFHGLARLEQRLLASSGFRFGAARPRDARSLGLESVRVSPLVSASGFVHRFGADDLARLRALDLDVLLRFGTGILRGDILALPRFGVLSFHHGDNRVNRGGPPGYWEVVGQEDATGYIIQRLTDELDGGPVLFRGSAQTRSPFLRNQELLIRESLPHLERLLLRVAADRKLPPAEAALPYGYPLLRSPGVTDSARYVVGQALHWGRKLGRRLRGQRYRWAVAVQPRRWRDAVAWRATEIPNPPGHFLADPFVVRHDGRTCVFVEDYDYASGKGVIAAYTLTDDGNGPVGIERDGVVLDEPFHLSYPFLFHWKGDLYLCPESQQARELRIYRCIDFPLQWELAAVPMRDVDLVDPVLFEHDGQWWLLANAPSAPVDGGRDDCFAELHAFRADHPLSDRWIPHPLNPLVVDSTRARNGGWVNDGGSPCRVSQRYGYDQYGVSATVATIERLDDGGYREVEAVRLGPTFERGLAGFHHLHSDHGWTVFDYARYERE